MSSYLINGLAILLAFGLRRWWHWNLPHSWQVLYLNFSAVAIDKVKLDNPRILAFLYLIPFMLLVVGVNWLCSIWGIIPKLMFATLLLLLCLGDKKISTEFDSVLVSAHEQNFGILFWFMLLGPVGAASYWFLASPQEVAPELRWLHAVMAWIPARITGFIYALVGNFNVGFDQWRACMLTKSMHSSKVLMDCGLAASEQTIPGDDMRLVQRALWAWVIFSLIIVYIRF